LAKSFVLNRRNFGEKAWVSPDPPIERAEPWFCWRFSQFCRVRIFAMARASRIWTILLWAALLLGAAAEVSAQSAQNGSLTGKLTDLHSAPISNATVLVRNQATGVEERTKTEENGAFHFADLSPGEYALEASSPRVGRGSIETILIDAGHDSRVQAAIEFSFPPVRPLRVIFRALETESVALAAMIEPGVPAAFPMPGRRAVIPSWKMPVLVLLTVNTTLEAEPLPLPALGGRTPNFRARAVVPPVRPLAAPATRKPPAPEAVALAMQTIQDVTPLVKPAGAAARNVWPPASVVTSGLPGGQLQALPASGRRWENFVLDNPPSAAQTDDEEMQRSNRREPAAVSVDGVSRSLAFGGRGIQTRGRGSSMNQPGISEAAIGEVTSDTGAERSRAGRLNLETRRGDNGLHGQGFVFDRQNSWGAQNPFTQWVKETAPPTFTTVPAFTGESYTPPDHELTFGAGIGGHIRRDKLFWFAALDGFGRNDPGLSTVRNPDEFFSQPTDEDLRVLGARLESGGGNTLAAYSGMLETLDTLLGPAPRTAQQWSGFGRLDWEAAERHRLTLEGIGAWWNAPGGGLTRVSEMYGSHSFGSSQAAETWLLGRWEAFLTPNLLAVTQASAGRTLQQMRPETPTPFEQQWLAPNLWGQLPQIVVDSRYGFTIGNPSRYGVGSYPDERRYEADESLDYVRRGLLVKAGFSLSHNSDATSLLRNQTGTYHYANVANFISDALAFQSFGSDSLDTVNQHGCDQTGKVWENSAGPQGLGPLPCYSYYTQTVGPAAWQLSTNDWAFYGQAQWQPGKRLVFSAGFRWEREQLPPPIPEVANPDLPLTGKLPNLGNQFGPRLGVAFGSGQSHWPVLRLGYGMYFGRTENAVIETALTQTGSASGDRSLFMRPTDDLPDYGGGAPAFPYVLAGLPASVVKPGVVEFASNFRNPEIHQAVASIEETLPGHVYLTAGAELSLGRRLPISVDTNFDPAGNPGTITAQNPGIAYDVVNCPAATPGCGVSGPIKATKITVPFYASNGESSGRLNPNYQQISQIMSRANSTYEAAVLKLVRYSRRGLSFHLRYTYSHAMDWNPNESTQVAGSDVLDPARFSLEYGTSDLDIRHSATAMVVYETPWKVHHLALLANGWMLSSIGNFRSGMPYTMRTEGSLAGEVTSSGELIEALASGMNGSGGDNRVYGWGSDGVFYNIGRNTYRYPQTWKADLRLGKRFNLGDEREIELLAESFNLFNHQNVTELETTGYYIERGSSPSDPPTLNYLTGLKANTTAFGQPLNINATDFYRERQIDFGLRMRF
jgi:hypothetical protein